MNPDLLAKTQPIFEAVLDLPPEQWPESVRHHCRGDLELENAVLALLRQSTGPAAFLDQSLPSLLSPAESSLSGRQVGDYLLREKIGVGGHSAVYRAEPASPLYRRPVAVKLLRAWSHPGAHQRRFEREIRILAELQHPAIVRLFGGGVTPDGFPYLVMELVEGLPLNAHCRQHDLPLPARLRLFTLVAEAVFYAHQHLIIHRDLKPANLLVTPAGEPKLLDFGVAKLLADDADRNLTTLAAPAGLTFAYASPEQLDGRASISTAADQYSLGVMLYELACGRRPFQDLEDSTARFCRAIAEQSPPPPSRFAPGLDRDLDAIILKCLEREPESRYPSVDALRLDLLRYLNGEVVTARPVPRWVPLWRFCRRHWLASSLLAGLLALAIGLSVVWTQNLAQQRSQLRRAAALELCQRAAYLTGLLPSQAHPDAVPAMQRALASLQSLSAQVPLTRSDLLLFGDFASTLGSYAGHPASNALGQIDLAERFFQTGLNLLAAHPQYTDRDLRLIETRIHHFLGGLLIEKGRPSEAEITLTRGLQTANHILQTHTLEPREQGLWRLLRVNLTASLSRIRLHQGHLDQCITLRRHAVAEAAELYHELPTSSERETTLAGLKAALAWALRENGQPAAALRELEEARALLDDFLKPTRVDGYITSMAARGLYEEGKTLLLMNRPRDAEPRLHRAIEAFRRLQKAAPLSPMADRTLMQALAHAAEAAHKLNRPPAQVQSFAQQAHKEAELVQQANPGNARLPEELEELHQTLTRAGVPPPQARQSTP